MTAEPCQCPPNAPAGLAYDPSVDYNGAETLAQLGHALDDAAPLLAEINSANDRLQRAERDLSSARLRDRLDQLARPTPQRTLERGHGIEL